LDLDGLGLSNEVRDELFRVDGAEWRDEVTAIGDHHSIFGDRVPRRSVSSCARWLLGS
jgi:GTP-dependent phosphoenolpyruvate carboxykinase